MKTITLKQELAIMANTRGAKIPYKYTVCGKHFSSLKAAINAAKNTHRNLVHVMVTSESVRFKTVAAITRKSGYFEVVVW
jgi:hypothetical protein